MWAVTLRSGCREICMASARNVGGRQKSSIWKELFSEENPNKNKSSICRLSMPKYATMGKFLLSRDTKLSINSPLPSTLIDKSSHFIYF